jgi:hypothetical protein
MNSNRHLFFKMFRNIKPLAIVDDKGVRVGVIYLRDMDTIRLNGERRMRAEDEMSSPQGHVSDPLPFHWNDTLD